MLGLSFGVLYRFQFKSYLPIAAKRGKALAPRFPQPLCQIGLNLESVLFIIVIETALQQIPATKKAP